MAFSFSSCEHEDEEEDYIDMEVSSSTTFLCYTISSPPQHREFEFHMSSASLDRKPSTSPADELFYEGKLLPLHQPPRFQMVEKLLDQNQNSIASSTDDKTTTEPTFEENYSTPTITTFNTPFESCNVSPSESCWVSQELNPEVHFLECPTEQPKKSWSKKLKLIRQSSLGLKLKASRAYLKSLFSKSGCSYETSAEATRNGDEATNSKAKECLNSCMKVTRKNPFGQIQRVVKDSTLESGGGHRRSFSGAIKCHSATKSSSSSSSFSSGSSSSSSFSSNPNGFYELQLLKRSSSVNSEFESSIQGAIAHCKKSQQLSSSRKTVSEVGFCSFSVSRIAVCKDQARPRLCRGF
ncbi:hypothetical protein NE237_003509 [Protea cynaroides]|uniref:Membrane-associated kinase regulator 4 n=1 Tax=Protea cynaroides TaxID=273540 RepID=A0A9Q0QSN3_9MAGN|nr:hypothetical protein NE237_003509 [Protea cynaroides]